MCLNRQDLNSLYRDENHTALKAATNAEKAWCFFESRRNSQMTGSSNDLDTFVEVVSKELPFREAKIVEIGLNKHRSVQSEPESMSGYSLLNQVSFKLDTGYPKLLGDALDDKKECVEDWFVLDQDVLEESSYCSFSWRPLYDLGIQGEPQSECLVDVNDDHEYGPVSFGGHFPTNDQAKARNRLVDEIEPIYTTPFDRYSMDYRVTKL
ncbi:hypothetical protein ACOME3_003638 [Neoechinorhynchus agilis]